MVQTVKAKPVKIEEKFQEWCKLTKRGGGVLVGASIREFFDWLKENDYVLVDTQV